MAVDPMQELHEEKLKLVNDMRSLHTENESDWKPEYQEQWDRHTTRIDEIEKELGVLEDKAQRAAKLAGLSEKMEEEEAATKTEIGEARQVRSGQPTEMQKCDLLQGWIRAGRGSSKLEDRHKKAASVAGFDLKTPEFDFNLMGGSVWRGHQMWSTRGGASYLPSKHLERQQEQRDLAVSSEPEIIPQGFLNEFSQTLLAFGGMRRVARIIATPTGNQMDIPTSDDTGNSGALLAEATTIGSSVDPTITKVQLDAYKYSSTPILVSAELEMDSAFNLSQLIAEMLAIRIGRATATAYATGTGSSQPEGVTIGSTLGKTTASNSAITTDELKDLVDALDPAYAIAPSVGWVMRQATRGVVAQLKDTTNQYLWQPGLTLGMPDMLLGAPLSVVQEIPAIATTAVVACYGDYSEFLIRDAGPTRFFRLDERYRDTDQVAFVSFARHDSVVRQATAIQHLKMAV